MKKVGVVLSGCGFKDGAEVQESVLALLALDRAGADVVCMAPDIPQAVVTNHLEGRGPGENRNVLEESARIARGQIRELSTVRPEELDALVLPGGYGVALSLSSFANDGAKAKVHAPLRDLIVSMHASRKPIGAICIAPAVVACVLGSHGVRLTTGRDEGTAKAIEATGARHVSCPVEGVVVDAEHRIVSTPAYMVGPSIRHVAAGIELCIAELMRMA